MAEIDPWGAVRKAWLDVPAGRFINRGHPIGDFLEADRWQLLEERKGYLRIEAHLPMHVRNLRGQLFGGFTPTYVDFLSLYTVRAGMDRRGAWGFFLATTNMRVDYFEPVVAPSFVIESELLHERGRNSFVEVKFFDARQRLAVFAVTTMRKLSDGPSATGNPRA
ncbi:MAG TPA: PaaI family thioesterase [Terriglobales bacterium]|nr:PaaI family thioesterase [Terriglobales bacterium]